MKILTVTSLFPRRTAPSLGIFILQRVRAVAAKGAVVRVISPLPWVPPGPVPSRYARIRETPSSDEIGGLPVRYPRYFMVPKVGMRWQARGYAAGVRRCLREEVERFAPDLLDVHYLYPDACAAARLARDVGLPWVCTARGSDVNVLGRMPALQDPIRRALAEAGAVLAVSKDLAARMKELGLHDGPIQVVPNGVDRGLFRPRPRTEARASLGLPADGRFVLCIGHLVPVHGQELLIRALARPEAPHDLVARFIGDGPDRPALESLAAGLGVSNRVVFHGAVPHEQVPWWLSAADFSAQLSRSAGSPNAVLESVACGTRVLATDIPAMREALPPGGAGRLVPRDEAAVAIALDQLSRNGSAVPSGGVRSWEEVADEVLGLYAGVAGGGA